MRMALYVQAALAHHSTQTAHTVVAAALVDSDLMRGFLRPNSCPYLPQSIHLLSQSTSAAALVAFGSS